MSRRATFAELTETWEHAEKFWTTIFPEHTGPPWVKAAFMLNVFKVTLAQRLLRPDPRYMTAGAPEETGDE